LLLSLVPVLEKLITVVQLRESDRRLLFKEVAEPLFVQLQPAVDDLFAMFRGAKSLLEQAQSTQEDLAAAVTVIRENREKMLHLRRAIAQLAAEIEANVKDKRVVEFASKVQYLFYSTRHRAFGSKSLPGKLTEFCDYVFEERLDRGLIHDYLDTTLRQLEDNWVAIAQSYATLRIHCMTPARYKAK
jgi:hypothetical protein